MYTFKNLIQSLSEYTGVDFEVAQDGSLTIMHDDLIIVLQYIKDQESINIFSHVTDPETTATLSEETLRTALQISYNGEGTEGNFLGIFDESLILSNTISMNNLTAEILAEKILRFTTAAVHVFNKLLVGTSDVPKKEPPKDNVFAPTDVMFLRV